MLLRIVFLFNLVFIFTDYFLVDVWPREVKSGGRNLLATPAFL